MRASRSEDPEVKFEMSLINLFIGKHHKIYKSIKECNSSTSQLSFSYGMRDGKKKLKKGSYLVGVNVQWVGIANRRDTDDGYRKIRLLASAPGKFEIEKISFKKGMDWMKKAIIKEAES